MKFIFLFILFFSIVNFFPLSAQERAVKKKNNENLDKFALVIGNSNYKFAGSLKNPVNDAEGMKKVLEKIGFNVDLVIDASQKEIENSIQKLGRNLYSRNSVGLFYYAGHGIQFEGENYLIPVEANPATPSDLRYDAVPLGRLLNQFSISNNYTNIIILDACRNNPFPSTRNLRTRGLAQVKATQGTFISYATSPGEVAIDGSGNNSVFTASLLDRIQEPNLKIEELFKLIRQDVILATNRSQIPWEASSLTDDFYFVQGTKKIDELNNKIKNKEQELSDLEKEQIKIEKELEIQSQKLEKETRRTEATSIIEENFDSNIQGESKNRIRINAGFHSSTIELNIKSNNNETEEINGSGLSVYLKYFFGKNISIDFITGAGSISGLKTTNGNEVKEETVGQGRSSFNFLSTNYNWGGYSDSILGEDWLLYVGIGYGVSHASFYSRTIQDNYEVYNRSPGATFGFDYRFGKNWLVGLAAYSMGSNPSGSRVEELKDSNETINSSSTAINLYVGYQLD